MTRARRAATGAAGTLALAALAFPTAGLAQRPEGLGGTVVVANKQADSATFVDLATGEVVGAVPTGRSPHELVVAADGRTAVITDYGVNTLTVLDVPTASVRRTVDLGEYERPHGIVFLPGDSLVAVTSEAARAVVVVRVADGTVVTSIATDADGSHMVGATADGAFLYTGDIGSHTVSELDRVRGRKLRSFEAAPQPEAVNVTPDGRRVFVGSNSEGTVSVIDVETGRRREIAGGFGWPYRMFLTPGAGQLIVPDLRGEALRFFDGASYEELGEIELAGAAPQGLTLHPDGRHLFLSLSARDEIAVIDIETREVVGYLPGGRTPDGIGYSPLTVR